MKTNNSPRKYRLEGSVDRSITPLFIPSNHTQQPEENLSGVLLTTAMMFYPEHLFSPRYISGMSGKCRDNQMVLSYLCLVVV